MRRVAVLLLAACGLSARLFAQVCATTPPVANSPSNVNLTPNSPVTFLWTAASGSPTAYEVIVDGNTSQPACLVTPSTSCTDSSGFPIGKHTWIVHAIYSTCTIDSASKAFTAGCPTSGPTLQFPTNGATNVSIQPTMTWSSVANANQYDILYGKVGTGACSGNATIATASTTSFNAPPLQPGTTYEWTVAAMQGGNSTCPAVLSTSCFTFTTACVTPGSFNLVSPANNDNTTPTPTFSWSAASGAANYVIHIGTSNPPPVSGSDPVIPASQTSYKPSAALAAGTYFWSVDALPSCGTPIRSSAVNSFTVFVCPTAAPALVSPSSGATATTSTVTFEWAAAASATSYDVELSTDGGATFSSIGNGTATTLTKTLPNGGYVWFVRALYGTVCPAIASARSTFTVAISTSNCAPPQLVAPANGAANVASPVDFDWNDVAGATSYRLYAAFNGGSPTLLALTTDSEYSGNVPGGKVEWWVEASGPSCSSVSNHFTFSAIDNSGCPPSPGTPTLTAPAGGASVASPVTFQWTAVPGASSYRVLAALGSSATTSRQVLGTTTDTKLIVSVPQGNVDWLVEARFDNCPSTFSQSSTFTVTTATTCNNPAPTLLSPANGATNVASPVTFNWTQVPGATKYTLILGSDDAGDTTDHTLTRIVPAGTTSWSVVASFAGCPDVPSATFTFTIPSANNCATGAIGINAPAANATVTSPVSFSWTALPNTLFYRVWASFNGGPSAIIARTTDASANGVKLPGGAITFRVEAVFGTCSVFSPDRQITVQSGANCSANQPVTLKAPSSGATLTSAEIDFSWSAAPGAALYRVWVSSNGEPFVDVGTTTATTLHEDVPNGPAVWYVETFFEGCAPLPSAKSSFTVNTGTSACSGDAPMLVTPANNAFVSSPVTLVWSAVVNAEEYRVFAALDGGQFNLIERTSDTSTTKRLPPGAVHWFVEAVSDECPATRSPVSTFTIRQSQSCPTNPPRLVFPADGAQNVAPPVRLDWDPVSGAIGYAVFARHNDGAPTPIGETTETQLQHPFTPGTVEWWVVALFNGCPPLESKHFSFNIAPPPNCSRTVAPLLQSPPDGATPIASPVHFAWSHVPGATKYKVWAAIAGGGASVIGTTAEDHIDVDVPSGIVSWFVEADFATCPAANSTPGTFVVRKGTPTCSTPNRPTAKAPAQVASGTPYYVRWTPETNATTFELEESLNADFSTPTAQNVTGLATIFQHTVISQPTRWYYRVRALSDCDDTKSHFSKVVSVVVLPPAANTTRHTSAEVGVRNGITQKITLPGQNPPTTFSARADKPYITVTPSSGPIGPDGVTLTVTFDPTALALGTNTGTIIITYGTASKTGSDATGTGVPVNVSLVTPVSPTGKNTPLPNSLIIPAVGHAAGANNSLFESDLRIANVSAQSMKYLLNFTLSNTDGTQAGQSTTIQVDPGATMALDDILANFFGIGADGSGATGTLEIRPLTTTTSTAVSPTAAPSVQTVASSRTYDTTPTGTFGQYIPAIPYSQFIGQGSGRISLQQIAQSAAFRTNFGLVEASGQPADVLVHVFDNSGNEVTSPIPISLLPGEHKQINAFLAANNISLSDGRIEVEVTSATGKVTAYASTVDNVTNDPLLVFPVLKGSITSSHYVVPGIADLNGGAASWRSDMRIFNGGANAVNVTLAYVPQPGNVGTDKTVTFPLNPGEVHAIDNAMQTAFGLTNTGGSVVITTDAPSSLVATARTYNQTPNGTYGQFIPGVSPQESVGVNDRTLQILQLESSTRFRTNIGVTETTGKDVTVLVTAIPSDSKIAAQATITLTPNEFYQFSLDSFGLGTLYNTRVTVKVISGSGKVTAYGSVIDQQTQDPTYVVAQ